jgi:hypothetical protein
MSTWIYNGMELDERPMFDGENRYAIEIVDEMYPSNPREEYDHAWTFAFTNNRYFSGDKTASHEEEKALVRRKGWVCVPVYAYVHGAVAFSIGSFADQWDSGCCGYAYAKLSEWGKRNTEERRTRALDCLKGELEEYQAYCNGDTHLLHVVDLTDEEDDEYTGGYYGWRYAVEAAHEELASLNKKNVDDESIYTMMQQGVYETEEV